MSETPPSREAVYDAIEEAFHKARLFDALFDELAEAYVELVHLHLGSDLALDRNPTTNPFYEIGDEASPFLSEAFLYSFFADKEPARALLSRVDAIAAALRRHEAARAGDSLLARLAAHRKNLRYALSLEVPESPLYGTKEIADLLAPPLYGLGTQAGLVLVRYDHAGERPLRVMRDFVGADVRSAVVLTTDHAGAHAIANAAAHVNRAFPDATYRIGFELQHVEDEGEPLEPFVPRMAKPLSKQEAQAALHDVLLSILKARMAKPAGEVVA